MRLLLVTALVAVLIWNVWYFYQPLEPKELFEDRCAGCHELPLQKLCSYSPAYRGRIVDFMRSVQGADANINEKEALRIKRYLRENLACPEMM